MSAASVCTRCGRRPVAAAGRRADEPGEQALCAECGDYERGRMALDTLTAAGLDMSPVDRESEDAVAHFGRGLRALWYAAPEELLLEMERTETPEQVAAFADYLREIGESTDEQPSPAVQAFLDRHPPSTG